MPRPHNLELEREKSIETLSVIASCHARIKSPSHYPAAVICQGSLQS